MQHFRQHLQLIVSVGILTLSAQVVSGQRGDSIAESLGLTSDEKTLPVWANPGTAAKQSLADFVQSSRQGVMIIGSPRHGYGTGFVISREHRLVATNAHVADIMHGAGSMMAITNGTSQTYEVTRAWYHPGVRRRLAKSRSLVVRSMDPREGDVDVFCPDLAVLQLADDGPELPIEMKMATQDELKSLFSQPVAMLGYPGHDVKAWPAIGSVASATYHTGVVSRLTGFQLNATANTTDQQFVQYTMATWQGFSGSPVFLPNGNVVAVNNMARYIRGQRGQIKTIAHGVRIDCLWELLVHHGLDAQVPIGVDKSQVRVARWLRHDPKDDKYRQAVNLAREALYLLEEQDYRAAVDRCNKALKLAPSFAVAYQLRTKGYVNYYFFNYRKISKDAQLTQLNYALSDNKKYLKLAPSDPEGFIGLATVSTNIAVASGTSEGYRQALAIANKLLASENLSTEHKARAYGVRGTAYTNLQEPDRGLQDLNEAIRLDPTYWMNWENRAAYWDFVGRPEQAKPDRRKARELREREARRLEKTLDVP